jgi:hypothetical protein
MSNGKAWNPTISGRTTRFKESQMSRNVGQKTGANNTLCWGSSANTATNTRMPDR